MKHREARNEREKGKRESMSITERFVGRRALAGVCVCVCVFPATLE